MKGEVDEHSKRADRERLNHLKAIRGYNPNDLTPEEERELEELQSHFDDIDQEVVEQIRERVLPGGAAPLPDFRELNNMVMNQLNGLRREGVPEVIEEEREVDVADGQFDIRAILRQHREARARVPEHVVNNAPDVHNAPPQPGGGPPPPPRMNFPLGGNGGGDANAGNPMAELFAVINNGVGLRRRAPRVEFELIGDNLEALNSGRDELTRLEGTLRVDPLDNVRNFGVTFDGYNLIPHADEDDLLGISHDNLRNILIDLNPDLALLLAAPETLLMVPVLAASMGLKNPKDIREARLKLFLQGSGDDMRIRIETTKEHLEGLLTTVNGTIMQLYALTDQLAHTKRDIEDNMDRQAHNFPQAFKELQDDVGGLTNLVASYPERLLEYLEISPLERKTPTEISVLQNCELVMTNIRIEKIEADNEPFLVNAEKLFTALRAAYNGSDDFQRLISERIEESMEESKRPIRLLYQADGHNMEDLRWIRTVLAAPAAVGGGKTIMGQYERFYRPSALHPLETLALFHILYEVDTLQEHLPRTTVDEIADADKAGDKVDEILRNLRLHYGTAASQFSQAVKDHFDLTNDASDELNAFTQKLRDAPEDFAALMMHEVRSEFVEQDWQLRTGCPPPVDPNDEGL